MHSSQLDQNCADPACPSTGLALVWERDCDARRRHAIDDAYVFGIAVRHENPDREAIPHHVPAKATMRRVLTHAWSTSTNLLIHNVYAATCCSARQMAYIA